MRLLKKNLSEIYIYRSNDVEVEFEEDMRDSFSFRFRRKRGPFEARMGSIRIYDSRVEKALKEFEKVILQAAKDAQVKAKGQEDG